MKERVPVLGSQASAALTLGKGVGWEVSVTVSLRALLSSPWVWMWTLSERAGVSPHWTIMAPLFCLVMCVCARAHACLSAPLDNELGKGSGHVCPSSEIYFLAWC